MTRAGLEPALPKETVLETVALDHSANESKPPAGLEPAIYRLEVCRLIRLGHGGINSTTIIEIARSINSWLRVYLLCDGILLASFGSL